MDNWQITDSFAHRHIGPRTKDLENMFEVVGVKSFEELIEKTIPEDIRLKEPFQISSAVTEHQILKKIKTIAEKNKIYKSYIGMGYYNCILPNVILRNILENPGWYTQYTPYQSEISQGRLEALLNFQTMVSDLTSLPVANASLLDEATAAAEAMAMFFHAKGRKKKDSKLFLVSDQCFPQTIDVLATRAEPLGIEIRVVDIENHQLTDEVFGALLCYPGQYGNISDLRKCIQGIHDIKAFVAISTDLLPLVLLTSPGELGADVALGNAQSFGIPFGYGGPHAAFFSCTDQFKRKIPGRIVGISTDRHGKPGYRLALQTREQHIRREKATSNICTAQALLAIMAGMYAVYHGPDGLKKIAQRIHNYTSILNRELQILGYRQTNNSFFNTLKVQVEESLLKKIQEISLQEKINFRYLSDGLSISIDETTSSKDIEEILSIFAKAANHDLQKINYKEFSVLLPKNMQRKSPILEHAVFHRYHCETEMLRYLKLLENRDLSLTSSMIPLGSCTMKLNSATSMLSITWPQFSEIHPFVPLDQAKGYQQLIEELSSDLCKITGFDAVSFQPNSGAQGEYTGLMVIRKYHLARGAKNRNVVLIPSSAHGTNPASAAMAGMKIVIVSCDENGNIDIEDLKQKAHEHKDVLSAFMVTYPSTHGVFEEGIREICKIIHECGGLVYMDGANMNAQVGFTNPRVIGADVCHLNLHKTFGIPHGGGGPGMGPICVTKDLAPYLPSHCVLNLGSKESISAVSSAHWGSASILLISYAYIKMLGREGLMDSTQYAILNANYIKNRLKDHYEVLYTGSKGNVAHEMIFDFRAFSKTGITVEDVAKRLMDYGFHAPTVSFPVPGTLMIEPTESESKEELDRFCDAMIEIRKEIQEIEEEKSDREDNVLKNAPHTASEIALEDWPHSYSRKKAAYPLEYLENYKFWPYVARIDNVKGDRNLICKFCG